MFVTRKDCLTYAGVIANTNPYLNPNPNPAHILIQTPITITDIIIRVPVARACVRSPKKYHVVQCKM